MNTDWDNKISPASAQPPGDGDETAPDAAEKPIAMAAPISPRFRAREDFSTFINLSRTWAPTVQAMIVQSLKLIYLPIAKNACSSTKRLVAELGGLNLGPEQDIHFTLDNNNTGLQFKDHSSDTLTDAFAADDWMRFMIFRDPMDRLVSAYIEKFVINRAHPGQWGTCGDVIKAVYRTHDPKEEHFAQGVTFREFCEFILSSNPNTLDSHWQPQIFYMGHVPLTHIFDVKHLHLLEADLQEHVGTQAIMPHINASRFATREKDYRPEAVDYLPKDLGDASNLHLKSFLPEDLHKRLKEFYAADLSIYQQVQNTARARTHSA